MNLYRSRRHKSQSFLFLGGEKKKSAFRPFCSTCNQVQLLSAISSKLSCRDGSSYSYYIEVSMDELDWVRVVDHSKFLCRSWQNLFFTPRVCRQAPVYVSPAAAWLISAVVDTAAPFFVARGRYVRIVGTHNTVNKVFHLVAFECMFTNRTFTLEQGLLGEFLERGAFSPLIRLTLPSSHSRLGALPLLFIVRSAQRERGHGGGVRQRGRRRQS